MDDQTRRDVDAACLRLLGYEQNATGSNLWFNPYDTATVGKDGPSQDGRHVAPLAEALADSGWNVNIQNRCDGYWYVHLFHSERPIGRRVFEENTSPLALCLALAAARAVGEK